MPVAAQLRDKQTKETGMWAGKQTERHVGIKGRMLADRQPCRQMDIQKNVTRPMIHLLYS